MATALTDAGVPGRVEFLIGAGHVFSERDIKRTLREAMEFFGETLGRSGTLRPDDALRPDDTLRPDDDA